MDINATIIGQFLTFAILVWFTMKYVWPPIIQGLREREKKIAAGLDAAEKSKQELEVAEKKASSIVHEAKLEASHLIEQAHLHSAQVLEEAKNHAKLEGARIVEMAQGEIEREITKAKEALRAQLATLVVIGAEKILQRHLDVAAHQDILNQIVTEI